MLMVLMDLKENRANVDVADAEAKKENAVVVVKGVIAVKMLL